jgi:hypothetical protein
MEELAGARGNREGDGADEDVGDAGAAEDHVAGGASPEGSGGGTGCGHARLAEGDENLLGAPGAG